MKKKEKEYLLDDNDIISLIDQHLQVEIIPDKKKPKKKKVEKKNTIRIVLHLEIDEKELGLSETELKNLSNEEKRFRLSIALKDRLTRIDDWSKVWEYKES